MKLFRTVAATVAASVVAVGVVWGASFFDYSQTPASNASIGSVNFAEGQTPGSLNNSARQLMADLAKWRDDLGGINTTAGSANAQTLTTDSTLTNLADGQMLGFVAGDANTGNTTLNVDTIGAKKVLKITGDGETELASGDIAAAGHYLVQYDVSADSGTGAWILLNPANPDGLVIGTDVQAYSAKLAAIVALTWADNKIPVFSGTDTLETVDLDTGSWTPEINAFSEGSYAVQTGTYVKIGSLVFVSFVITNDGNSYEDPPTITGLPYAANAPAAGAFSNVSGIASQPGVPVLVPAIDASAQVIAIRRWNNTTGNMFAAAGTIVGANTSFSGSIVYTTDD